MRNNAPLPAGETISNANMNKVTWYSLNGKTIKEYGSHYFIRNTDDNQLNRQIKMLKEIMQIEN